MQRRTARRPSRPAVARSARTPLAVLAGASALALALTACGSSGDTAEGDDEGASGGESTTLTVFAAASLTDTYEQLGETFSEQHEGVDVQFSFAGSSDLVTQIEEGAPADVIATADERTMQQIFVSNTLVIAVPTGNPAGVEDLASLENPDLDVVVCAPQVPCGAATETVEEAGGITLTPVSEEPAVTDVLGKVANGQADAGLVYRTDAAGSEDVDAIEFDESEEAINLYPIAPVKDAENAELAQEFVDFILSDEARTVFDEAGFAAP
jgi:molybdate transport system substrate-binding protein